MPKCTVSYNGSVIDETDQNTPVSISYHGAVIASVDSGMQKTILCSGKYMTSDVVIGSRTLMCGGKLMSNDVSVSVESTVKTVPVTITGSGHFMLYVSFGGEMYMGAGGPYDLNVGDEITVMICGARRTPGTVKINGVTVLRCDTPGDRYNWTIPDCTSIRIQLEDKDKYGNVTITTS